jgi:hypothetical protein
MSPVAIIQRLVRAGMPIATIERKTGFGRSRLARVVAGMGTLSADERERLEEFAARHLPHVAMAAPHHERCPPRYGR